MPRPRQGGSAAGGGTVVTGMLAMESDNVNSNPKEVIVRNSQVTMTYVARGYSEENRPGYHANEDRFFCEHHQTPKDSSFDNVYICGVLDGHDGSIAAETACEQISAIAYGHIQKHVPIPEAFPKTMKDVEENLRALKMTAGCCVNTCCVWGRYIWCANLGDCRSLFIPLSAFEKDDFQTGSFVWLSRDQKGSMPHEKERITKLGGKVENGRVEGLEPTRTLGDFDIKGKTRQGVISITPEVRMVDVIAECEKIEKGISTAQGLVIMATDGVWDVTLGKDILGIINMRSKQIRVLQKYLAQQGQEFDPHSLNAGVLDQIAQDIVTFSVSKGSIDDCTVIVSSVSVARNKPAK